VILTYAEDYKEKIALHALYCVQNEMSKLFREALLNPQSPMYQSEGAILNRKGRIVINCKDAVTRDYVMECTGKIQWTGPNGIKSFKPWKATEAPVSEDDATKYIVHIRGPKRAISEFFALIEKQNPGLKTTKWIDFNNGEPEEGEDYNKSHNLFLGLDQE